MVTSYQCFITVVFLYCLGVILVLNQNEYYKIYKFRYERIEPVQYTILNYIYHDYSIYISLQTSKLFPGDILSMFVYYFNQHR